MFLALVSGTPGEFPEHCQQPRRTARLELRRVRAGTVMPLWRPRGASNPAPHFRMPFLDRVYVRGSGSPPALRRLTAPTGPDVIALARRRASSVGNSA